MTDDARQNDGAATGYPVIMNGDHAEFEQEWAGKDPKTRPDWPLQSFDALDWAQAFCKIAAQHGYSNAKGEAIDEGWMIGWFANALMRGFDEAESRFATATRIEPMAANFRPSQTLEYFANLLGEVDQAVSGALLHESQRWSASRVKLLAWATTRNREIAELTAQRDNDWKHREDMRKHRGRLEIELASRAAPAPAGGVEAELREAATAVVSAVRSAAENVVGRWNDGEDIGAAVQELETALAATASASLGEAAQPGGAVEDANAIPSHRILRTVTMQVCQACLNGEGSECHTPGCIMWLHRVDLPFDPLQYEVLDTFVVEETSPSVSEPTP